MCGAAVELVLDLQQACDLSNLGRNMRLRHSARRRTQREGDVVEHVEMWVQRVLLEHEGHVARARRLAVDLASAEHELADASIFQSRAKHHSGGLRSCA